MSRLRESIKLVIEESMQPNLELVKRSGRGFKITQLGSSIIDTGTEISTLEPLKKALDTLLRLLKPEIAADQIPVELLLLPIVVQNEAHRQIISGMPELRTDVAQTANRNAIIKWIGENFGDRGFTLAVSCVIGQFLAECDADPRHAPSGDTSSEFVHDACLRVFCGLLLWVSGESISSIHDKLRVMGVFAGTPVQINTNIAAFAERISWKLLFLSNLMRFSNCLLYTSRSVRPCKRCFGNGSGSISCRRLSGAGEASAEIWPRPDQLNGNSESSRLPGASSRRFLARPSARLATFSDSRDSENVLRCV